MTDQLEAPHVIGKERQLPGRRHADLAAAADNEVPAVLPGTDRAGDSWRY